MAHGDCGCGGKMDKKRKHGGDHGPPPPMKKAKKGKRKGNANSAKFGQACKKAAAECKASGGSKKYCAAEVKRCYQEMFGKK